MILIFTVKGMTCTMCSSGIEKAVKKLDGVYSVRVSLIDETMSVECSNEISTLSIIKVVESLGYKAYVYGDKPNEISAGDILKKRFFLSLLLLLPLVYLSMGAMFAFPLPSVTINFALQLAISAIILALNFKFFTMGVRAAINRSPNMDTLVALSSAASFILSVVVFVFHLLSIIEVQHLFFESSAMVVTLVTLGKWLEDRSKKRTGKEIDKLSKLIPDEAVIIKDGKETTVSTAVLKNGNELIFKSGDYICVDGEVISGSAFVDKSALTGESLPVEVIAGDRVDSGSILKSGYLKVLATNTGANTVFSKLIESVRVAASSKSPFQKYADKVSSVFVPIIIIISLITFVAWYFISLNVFSSFTYSISVLVISCPCALGLATPVAVMAATGKAATLGILYKDAESLQRFAKTNIVLLDKTATLTVGNPSVVSVEYFDEKEDLIKSVASAIEEKSAHPIADCIREFCGKSNNTCENFNYIAGKGAECTVDGVHYKLGNRALVGGEVGVEKSYLEKGMTPVFLFRAEKIIAMFVISDYIKDDSKEAVSNLKRCGLKTVMVTGDNGYAAKNIAESVGIKDFVFDVLPAEKAEVVKNYSAHGNVAFVGDGINDSIALKTANVGVAIGSGSDIAIDSADVVLVGGSLKNLSNAFELSRKAVKIIKENLFWAFFYNVIAIPIAAGVFSSFGFSLTPTIASACMSFSSVFVVFNALRITSYKSKRVKTQLQKNIISKRIRIEGMMCEHCAKKVEKILTETSGILSVKVNLVEKNAEISFDSSITLDVINNALSSSGYKVISIEDVDK